MNKWILDNGIRVVAETMPHYRSVSIGIWVKTGSRFESAQNNGISHLIEHMLFKGTKKYDTRTIASLFDRIGGNVNAFTTKEYTCFYAKVLDEHVEIALDVLADMYYDPLMDADELLKEKNVIYEEIAMYDDTPDDLVHDLISIAAFREHPLAYPILGTKNNLERTCPDDLFAYMEQFYNANNTIISVAGKVDELLLAKIRKYFDRPHPRGQRATTDAPTFAGDFVFRRKPTEQNHICFALPGLSLRDERLYALVVLNNIVGGGMSSRLFQEIREKRGLAYSVYSYHAAHADCGQFTIYLGTAPTQTKSVLDVWSDTIGELLTGGIHEEEFVHGKEQLKGGFLMSLESTGNRMNRLGKNELMLENHDSIETTLHKIEAIQKEDVDDLMRTMFSRPFAVACVGESDQDIQTFRRDQFVISGTN